MHILPSPEVYRVAPTATPLCADELPLTSGPVILRPVPAGFPSPADDYIEGRISLDEHLIQHKESTFFMRVDGDSMRDLGILHGDLLVIDRSLTPVDGNVVIAVVDGNFTVKQLAARPGGVTLRAANPAFADIVLGTDQALEVWGVVRWAIHRVWPCPAP